MTYINEMSTGMYAYEGVSVPPGDGEPAFSNATTLQELYDEAGRLFAEYRVDHAVLLSVPSARSSIVVPLLDMPDEMRSAIGRTIRLNLHPVAVGGREIMGFPMLSELCRSASPSPEVEELASAYRRAGFARTYMLPLGCGSAQTAGSNATFVLEVARKNAPIAVSKLAEIQLSVLQLPDKLAPLVDAMAHVHSHSRRRGRAQSK